MLRRCLAAVVFVFLLAGQQCLQPATPPDNSNPPSSETPRVTLHTNKGDIVIELFTQQGQAAGLFQSYIESGYYDDAIFHEVRGGLWVQGGMYTGQLEKKVTQPLVNESSNGLRNLRGRVALFGPSGQTSGQPRFLINLQDNPSLNFADAPVDYTVIGRVVEGFSIVESIGALPTVSKRAADTTTTLPNLPNPPVSVNNASFNQQEYPTITEPTREFALDIAVNYAAGTSPSAVVIADLNGDGTADLAAANSGSDNVSVLLADGKGAFKAAANYSVGSEPVALVAGNFNDDTNLDLAVVNRGGSSVTILLNEGDGTFTTGATLDTGTRPAALVTADFSADQQNDLAIASSGADTVTIKLGDGDGTFSFTDTVSIVPEPENPDDTPDHASRPVAIAAADVDQDGDRDLVVANHDSNNVTVLLNNGSGVFTASEVWGTGDEPSGLVAVDLDSDGDSDLAVCNGADNTVTVRRNGGANFGQTATFDVGTSPAAIAAGLLDVGNSRDLAVANRGDNTISVLLNKGSGAFEEARVFAVGTEPAHVAIGDVDGDGDADIVTANAGSNDLSVLYNLTGEDADDPDDGGVGAPTADAGSNRSIVTGLTVKLDGSGSRDPENDVLSYRWEQTGGPTVTLGSSTSATTTFVAPAASGSITFRLTVDDGQGHTDTDTVSLNLVTNPRVRLQTSMGTVVIDVLLSETPVTSLNFLQYVEDGFYNGTIFHRVMVDFVVQGGGFLPDLAQQDGLRGPIVNEFSPDRSNLPGTVAMAKVGGNPDSATSQFFFNLKDNSENLDNQNGGFTVFARVTEGFDVVLQMAEVAVTTRNDPDGQPFEKVPEQNIVLQRATIE